MPIAQRQSKQGWQNLNGVEISELNFHTETLHVSGKATSQEIISRVKELGYNVRDPQEDEKPVSQPSINFLQYLWERRDTKLALLATLLVLPGLLFHELLPNLGIHHPLIDIASVAAMVLAGYPIALNGWRAFRINRQVTINALMSIAAIGAVFIGAYTEAGVVMVLFVIGEALEGFTSERARRSIRGLMEVAPNEATLLETHDDHAHEKDVSVKDLKVGDLILVKPGKRIPMDGRVVSGSSEVNQAPITGEARLIQKDSGRWRICQFHQWRRDARSRSHASGRRQHHQPPDQNGGGGAGEEGPCSTICGYVRQLLHACRCGIGGACGDHSAIVFWAGISGR